MQDNSWAAWIAAAWILAGVVLFIVEWIRKHVLGGNKVQHYQVKPQETTNSNIKTKPAIRETKGVSLPTELGTERRSYTHSIGTGTNYDLLSRERPSAIKSSAIKLCYSLRANLNSLQRDLYNIGGKFDGRNEDIHMGNEEEINEKIDRINTKIENLCDMIDILQLRASSARYNSRYRIGISFDALLSKIGPLQHIIQDINTKLGYLNTWIVVAFHPVCILDQIDDPHIIIDDPEIDGSVEHIDTEIESGIESLNMIINIEDRVGNALSELRRLT